MSHSKQNFVGHLKRYGALSMDLRVPRCTQFIKKPSTVTLMMIPAILIGWKYPTIYMFLTYVSGS